MRTKPLYDEPFELDSAGTRDAPGFGALSVLLPPGRYTVQLTVDGQTQSQPLEVLKDPNSFATDQDIAASSEALLKLQAEQNAAGLPSDYDPAWSAAAFSNPVPAKPTTVSSK